MNRFCKSTFSLLLAILLLFSAAGISLGMVFQSTRAYAVGPSVGTPAPAPDGEGRQEVPEQGEQENPEEPQEPEEQPPAAAWSPQDQKINIMGEEKTPEKKETIPESEQNTQEDDEVEGGENILEQDTSSDPVQQPFEFLPANRRMTISDVQFGEKDIASLPVSQQSGTLYFEFFLKDVSEDDLKPYLDGATLRVSDNIFTSYSGNSEMEIELKFLEKADGGNKWSATSTSDVQFNNSASTFAIFTITFTDNDGNSAEVSSQSYRVSNGSERAMISSVIFKNQNGDMLSKVTPGTRGKLTVIVRDTRIYDEAKFEELHPKMYPKINVDAFSCHSTIDPNKDIVFDSSLSGGGVEYTITFSDVTYRGRNNYLILELNYMGLDYIDYPLDRYDLYEPAPDDNNNNNNYPDDDDDHNSSSSKPDIPPPTPNIIVSTYDYGGGNVTAAGNFTLSMTLMNTSKRVNVDNVVMKLGVPEAFTLTSSSNTFYIERIAKRSSVERTVNLSVKPNADAISHPIKVSFTYESVINDERKQFSAEQDISIPVSQLDRFSLNPVEMPSEIYVGEDSSIEATFVNKGKSTVYNVTAEITGNLSQPGQRQFIGNVESGKEESADFLIGALEAGTISGEVVISYEDANMNVNELRSPFTTTAVSFEMPAPDPGLDVMNPDDIGEAPPEPWYQKIPVWGWTTGGVTAIILLSFAAKAMRRHRELKLLEDSDEDF